MKNIIDLKKSLKESHVHDLSRPQLLEAKKLGFSDKQIAKVIHRFVEILYCIPWYIVLYHFVTVLFITILLYCTTPYCKCYTIAYNVVYLTKPHHCSEYRSPHFYTTPVTWLHLTIPFPIFQHRGKCQARSEITEHQAVCKADWYSRCRISSGYQLSILNIQWRSEWSGISWRCYDGFGVWSLSYWKQRRVWLVCCWLYTWTSPSK